MPESEEGPRESVESRWKRFADFYDTSKWFRSGLGTVFFLAVALVVYAIWIYYGLYIEKKFPDPMARGSYGESFGALNALFAGLAFAGVIVSMLMQRRELELQRQELFATRDVMKQQRDEMKLTRQLAAQPLIYPVDVEMKLTRPVLAFQGTGIHQSRGVRLDFHLVNRAPSNSVNIHVLATLSFHSGLMSSASSPAERKKTGELKRGFIAGEGDTRSATSLSIDFEEEDTFEIFSGIGKGELTSSASLTIRIFYRNLLGAYFNTTVCYDIDVDAQTAQRAAAAKAAADEYLGHKHDELETLRATPGLLDSPMPADLDLKVNTFCKGFNQLVAQRCNWGASGAKVRTAENHENFELRVVSRVEYDSLLASLVASD